MTTERRVGVSAGRPFPVYADLVEALAAGHASASAPREARIAHVLATCAAYAYADTETHSTVMARLGFAAHSYVRIAQTVEAMHIASTACLLQSQCGRVVLLAYRGTDPTALPAWLGNAEVGTASHVLKLADGAQTLRVHAGFHQNTRATWWAVIDELTAALEARSLADRDVRVDHPMQALYVTGHSLGGAMALIFALQALGNSAQRPIAERLRAVYTFGQPLATAGPLPPVARALDSKLIRHVLANDPIPSLPPSTWAELAHFGQEFRYDGGQWRRAESAVAQFSGLKELGRSSLVYLMRGKDRSALRYRLDEHDPHHYLAALRPKDRVTEFGDWE